MLLLLFFINLKNVCDFHQLLLVSPLSSSHFSTMTHAALLVIILALLPLASSQQATVRFEDTIVSINEGIAGLVRLRKTGMTAQRVTVIVQVSFNFINMF